ncbi:TrbG/VirB9 family P-type conjugative transfer protein [uncultured Roseibium sp.]|uniref:TrbG/VirB9 family P-type conjugative transfer protein n=1 Tax=uncultured Roseibium sp. TaxID=1936171 RepID=UPI00260F1D30|nr:TrbG/VirB9 family P-type conjugative transfer protein [uncultured Roseibium sp.]
MPGSDFVPTTLLRPVVTCYLLPAIVDFGKNSFVKKFCPLFAAAMLSITTTAPLQAEPASKDTGYQEIVFAEDNIYDLQGTPGHISTVRFAPGEKASQVLVGDTITWTINCLGGDKNCRGIAFKPTKAGAQSNMVVETNKRTYMFGLIASKDAGQKPVHYSFQN